MVIQRDIYLNKLISKKHNGLIKVVTGIRRCGISYLLSALNGCIGLVIAFPVSPCGLPMLAVKFVSAYNEFAERRTKHVPESEHVPITEFSEEKAIISGPMRHLRQAGDLRYSHINFRAALI